MDPTMQSPIQYGIPFSDGRRITVPSGPHHYQTETWVGSAKQGNTPLAAFEALKRHAIPFQGDHNSADGATMDVYGLGPIRQHVDDDRLQVVNSTMPGHRLHPGNVFRSVVQRGDDLYVVTEGYGTGIFPDANERGKIIWSWPDREIKRELDSGNASAATGTRSGPEGQAAPSAQPVDRPEHRIPPPIFSPN